MMMNPFSLWQAGLELAQLTMESQAVITMRLMGAAGLWDVTSSENSRMVSEKQEAFHSSAVAVGTAVLQGRSPDDILKAAIKPLRATTRANAKRLAQRGPKYL